MRVLVFVFSCVMATALLLGAGPKGGGNPPSSTPASTSPAGAAQQPGLAGNPGGLPMTPAAAMSPAPPMFFRHKTLFVLALAGDPATSAKLSVETARFITTTHALAEGGWAISAPGWGITEFINQCVARPESTIGALIYYNAVQENGSSNYLLIARGTTQVDADALIAECVDPSEPANKNVGVPIVISWAGNDAIGIGSRNSFSFLPLAAIATAVNAFNSAHSVSSSTTTTYTAPPVTSPTPKPNVLTASQVQTTTTSTKNASDATTLLAAAALTQLGSANTNVPGNNGDPQLKSAVQHLASDVMRLIHESCSTDSALSQAPCKWFVQNRLPGPRKDVRSTPLFERSPIVPIYVETPLPGPQPSVVPFPINSTIPTATPTPTPEPDPSNVASPSPSPSKPTANPTKRP
jgi:hypothetical protein